MKSLHNKAVTYFYLKNYSMAQKLLERLDAENHELLTSPNVPYKYKCELDFHKSFTFIK